MTNLEKKVEKLLQDTILNLGYDLYDVVYEKEGKDFYLRIFIDNQKGISLDDCEKVSNSVSDLLDEADCIKEQYYLEVSSVGIERVLREDKHFNDNIGNSVEVKLYKPIENKKSFLGELIRFDENQIQIKNDDKLLNIERKNIAIIKTIYKW